MPLCRVLLVSQGPAEAAFSCAAAVYTVKLSQRRFRPKLNGLDAAVPTPVSPWRTDTCQTLPAQLRKQKKYPSKHKKRKC